MSYAGQLAALQQAIIARAPETVLPLLDARPSLPERLDVYIEGYRLRLIAAVTADYPTLAHYCGAERLQQLARAYVEATPPVSYSLDFYPAAFAPFVAQYADGVAAAIAAVESAIAAVFWLPDSAPFTLPTRLASGALAALSLAPRTASRLLHLAYDVEPYLLAVRAGEPPPLPAAGDFSLLIVRHANVVKRHRLTPVEYMLLELLRSGISLSLALEQATSGMEAECATQLECWFAYWMAEGFFRVVG